MRIVVDKQAARTSGGGMTRKEFSVSASSSVYQIPEELRTTTSWVLWKKEHRDGKPTKVLYTANGSRASSTDPATWTTFEKALHAYKENGLFDGLGFVFHPDNPYCGADIDDVTEEAAQCWIDRFDSYTERSPSGHGFHII